MSDQITKNNPIPLTLMGFDFGLKRIGIAVGQTLTQTANPVATIQAVDGIPDWEQLGALIETWKPQMLIVGLPLNMDGSKQDITHAAERFANRLAHRYQLPVQHSDERLSSVAAREHLYEKGGYRAIAKGGVDGVAAKFILETWMLEMGQ